VVNSIGQHTLRGGALVLRAFRFNPFQEVFDLRVLRLRDSVHGDVVNLVFPYKNERVTDVIRFFDGVGNGFHQGVFLFLRQTWRGISINYWHNTFLGFQFVVFGHVMEIDN